MSKQVVMKYVEKYRERIDQGIAEELSRRLEEVRGISPHLVPVVEAMQELSVGGKRLRGILTILGYELAMNGGSNPTRSDPACAGRLEGEELGEVIKAAVVMEIFHLGLLIQDDWMDRDDLRRGVKTMHKRYEDLHTGNFVAMLSGDLTFGWGMEMISGLELPAIQVNKAIGVWGEYFTRVGYGQILDGLAVADEESLMQILALKSGEYSCVLPLQLGASLPAQAGLGCPVIKSQSDSNRVKRLMDMLGRYGMELGWVFQLRDDWLSEWGETDKTGKPVGGDAREGKKSFAQMYGKEKLESEIDRHVKIGRDIVYRDMGRGQNEKVKKVMEGLLVWMATRES